MSDSLVHVSRFDRHDHQTFACAISPDGALLATGSNDKTLVITDLSDNSVDYTLECSGFVHSVAWSHDGARIVASTESGELVVVNVADESHSIIFEEDSAILRACAISSNDVIAVGNGTTVVFLLEGQDNSNPTTLTDLSSEAMRLAFSPDGYTLAIGCRDGEIYIFTSSGDDDWSEAAVLHDHSSNIYGLCFRDDMKLLLATSRDCNASIWDIPDSGAAWPTSPRVVLSGHTRTVTGGAFLGDASHVVTSSLDASLRVWRVDDGAQTFRRKMCNPVCSLSCHGESGLVAATLRKGSVELWKASHAQEEDNVEVEEAEEAEEEEEEEEDEEEEKEDQALLHELQHEVVQEEGEEEQEEVEEVVNEEANAEETGYQCVRKRINAAEREIDEIDHWYDDIDKQSKRQKELQVQIAKLEKMLASRQKALSQIKIPPPNELADARAQRKERKSELEGIIYQSRSTIDSLTDCLEVSGLEDLKSNAFHEWLCDIGMCRLQQPLEMSSGEELLELDIDEIVGRGISFNDATALLLRGYIAHRKLSQHPSHAPPTDAVIGWTTKQTTNWIRTLGASYAPLAAAGWHGAALCSLVPKVIIKASGDTMDNSAANRFISLIFEKRREFDGNKEKWILQWRGIGPINGSP